MEAIPPRRISGSRQVPSGVRTGLVFGAVAGLVGAIQTYLAARFSADREADTAAFLAQNPTFHDAEKGLFSTELLFFVGTGAVVLLLGIVLSVLSAYVVAQRSGRSGPGVRTALIAGIVGWAIYLGGCQGVIIPSYPSVRWNFPLASGWLLLLVVVVVGTVQLACLVSWVAAEIGASRTTDAWWQAVALPDQHTP